MRGRVGVMPMIGSSIVAPEGATVAAANSAGSLPPCGGGLGRGVAADSEFAVTPLPVPPPQGGREPCGVRLRNTSSAAVWAFALSTAVGGLLLSHAHAADLPRRVVSFNVC